ncbi:MAG: hypothetical protein IJM02_01020 [Clostridia bacterium]|nr:hypothetical protein [Clostridia bacterium]
MIKDDFDPNANEIVQEDGTIAEDYVDTVQETAEEAAQDAVDEATGEAAETEAQDAVNEIIDDSESEDSAEESEEDEGLCPRCKTRKISKGHTYCYRCEESLSRKRVPVIGLIAALLALLLSAFCFLIVCLDLAPAFQTMKGDRALAKKNLFSAYTAYSEVDSTVAEIQEILGANSPLNNFVKGGLGIKSKMFKAITGIYDPLRTYQRATNVYGEDVSEKYLAHDKFYQECGEYYKRFEKTYAIIQEPLDMMQDMEEVTPENGETVIALFEEKRNEKGCDPVIFDYFYYTVLSYYGMDKDRVLESIEKLDEDAKATGLDYSWLYYKEYARELIKRDRVDEAVKLLDVLTDRDISAYDPTAMKARAYISLGETKKAEDLVEKYCRNNMKDEKTQSDSNYSLLIYLARALGKTEEAKAVIAEAKELYPTVPEYDRQEALIFLTEGDYDQAFESAYSSEQIAYNIASYYGDTEYFNSEMLMNTVYISAKLCKLHGKQNTENAQYLDEVIKYYETVNWDQQIIDIAEGKTDIKEITTKGACDFI